jgi:hypothetical protein
LSPAATLVAGVLAGTGRLHAKITVDDAVAELREIRESASCWVPGPFADESALDTRLSEFGRPLARWAPPDAALVSEVADVLVEAWRQADLRPGTAWAPPAIRLATDSLDAARQLQALGAVDDWRIVANVRTNAGRISWSWPLLVTAPDAATAAELRDTYEHDRYYRIVDAGDVVVDIAVVDPAHTDVLDRMEATLAIVVDAAGWDPSDLLDRAQRVGLAGVLLVQDPRADGLVDKLVRELAHDEPLDVAASLVAPGRAPRREPRSCSGSPRSARGRASSPAGSTRRRARRRRCATSCAAERFDRESNGGEAVMDLARQIAPDVLREMMTIRITWRQRHRSSTERRHARSRRPRRAGGRRQGRAARARRARPRPSRGPSRRGFPIRAASAPTTSRTSASVRRRRRRLPVGEEADVAATGRRPRAVPPRRCAEPVSRDERRLRRG